MWRDEGYLLDILQAARRIQAFAQGVDETRFLTDDLIQSGAIEPTVQVFQAPGGATTKKAIYKFYYHYAYSLGKATEEPQLKAQCLTDKNGHVLPYVTFEGGRFELRSEALDVLRELSR